MNLILLPIFFLIFSLIETEPTQTLNKLPKNWRKIPEQELDNEFNRLDYITIAPLEIDRLRSRLKYVYRHTQ